MELCCRLCCAENPPDLIGIYEKEGKDIAVLINTYLEVQVNIYIFLFKLSKSRISATSRSPKKTICH